MRIYGSSSEGAFYRVFDYRDGVFRTDCLWVDDITHQLGIVPDGTIEQRKSVTILKSIYWVAVDLPAEDKPKNFTLAKEEGYGDVIPYVHGITKVKVL